MSDKKEKAKRKMPEIGANPGCLACGRNLHLTGLVGREPQLFGTILPVVTDDGTYVPGAGLPICLKCIDTIILLVQRETSRHKGNGEKT